MKKLFFTLAICLFSLGVFASNGNSNGIISKGVEISQPTQEELPDGCTIEVTTIITIDHGTWTETITIVTIEPCPFGY